MVEHGAYGGNQVYVVAVFNIYFSIIVPLLLSESKIISRYMFGV
jgi:hypothetical protein